MTSAEPVVHVPVLEREVLRYLVGPLDGTYVDATFGRGGHCRALLAKLDSGARVLVLDRDPEAVASARRLAAGDPRLTVVHARFARLAEVLAEQDIDGVDGVLMDVGVSSPQLEDARRGFSFLKEGPLDMRMDSSSGPTAAEWLNQADEAEIAQVLFDLGEERFARRVAAAICRARPIETTTELAEVVAEAVPHGPRTRRHPATRTFQAIRIKVNEEDQELARGLDCAFAALRRGGRLAVITFHSLEDRAVKQRFRALCRPPELPRRLPVRAGSQAAQAVAIAGPIRAGSAELAANPRARSATLRVIEKA